MPVRSTLVPLALAALTLGTPVHPLSAQLETGQLVRVTLAGDGRVTGTLAALSADDLVLAAGGETRTIPRADVARLEVSQGSYSRWKTGAVVGAAVGAVGTFLVLNSGSPASTNICDSGNNQDAIGMGPCLALAGFGGGLGGALVGGVVGSLIRSERWGPASLEGVGVTLPVPGRARLLGVTASLATPF